MIINDQWLTGNTWVTGGRGFIGRHLGRRLQQTGHKVAGLGHGHWPEARSWGFTTWLNGDVRPDGLQTLLKLAGPPDAIFHLAGGSSVGPSIFSPAEDFQRTVESTLHLLEWVRTTVADARVIYVSSAAVYGTGYKGPIRENSPTHPTSPYGFHKRMGEELAESYAQQFGLRVVIARLFSVYGPELKKQLLWDLCTRLYNGQSPLRLLGTGQEFRDWLHIEDAVGFLLHLSNEACSEPLTFNGGTGVGTANQDLAEYLAAKWDSAISVVFTGEPRPGDPPCLVADTTASRRLGFEPTRTWQDGIVEYLQWFRSTRGV